MIEEATGIPETWINTTIGSISKVKGGKRLPKGETLIQNKNSHPYIRITDFQGNSINKNQLQFVPDKTFEKISRYIVNENDVIISIVGTIGLIAKIDKDLNNASLTENCVKLINLKKVDSDYLFFYLTSRIGQSEINKNTVGAVQKKLPIYGVQNINITLPPLQEQKTIANVLTAFDDKIENLRAQNDTLEQTAQTIFTEWFGKYQLEDELPKGWRVGKLSDLTTKISKGTTPRKIDIENLEVSIPFLKVKDISNEGLVNKNTLELIPNEVHLKQLKRSILETHDLLFSIAGTIGRVAIINKDLTNTNCNQALAFIRLKRKDIFLEYVHLWLRSTDVQNEINSSIVQGVQANVSLTVLGNLLILIPNTETINNWNRLIKPIYLKMLNNQQHIESLTKTRNTLLPKLMSGQLRVKNVKMLELTEKENKPFELK